MCAARHEPKPSSAAAIWHNPRCATSRKVLAAIRAGGVEPTIVEYLKTPPGAGEIKAALAAMGMTPRQLLRRKGTPYDELGLDDPKWTSAQLIALMAKHPLLIERPVVCTRKGTRLCRPPERLKEIL
ncbi:MAG: arsenate reductase (glutaredoxin) [Alphaproteobacteria bacterium]|nr:arsenate reductase (glutaredoxin) [Alphaproteobacteria bacterium]